MISVRHSTANRKAKPGRSSRPPGFACQSVRFASIRFLAACNVTSYGQVTVRLKADAAGVPAGTKVETTTLSPAVVFVAEATAISPPPAPTREATDEHEETLLPKVTSHTPLETKVADTGPPLLWEAASVQVVVVSSTNAKLFCPSRSPTSVFRVDPWPCNAVTAVCSAETSLIKVATWVWSVAIKASSASTRSSKPGSPPACDSPPPLPPLPPPPCPPPLPLPGCAQAGDVSAAASKMLPMILMLRFIDFPPSTNER